MSKPAQLPSVVRAVHYHGEGNSPEETHSGPFAAIITAVVPDSTEGHVHLAVFMPGNPGVHAKTMVPFAENPTKHCWSWPPRVP
jgi:hypothetical protein